MAAMQESERGVSPLTLGWREWVALPDLGVPWIKVKVDTGARSSALHAFDLERVRTSGEERVAFVVHPFQRDTSRTVRAEGRLIDERVVRNSGGGEELRPVIATQIELFGQRWPIELTLTRRDVMGFRMLLGRQALRGRALIDPGRSYLAGRRKRARAR
jgi:hypothetical protein